MSASTLAFGTGEDTRVLIDTQRTFPDAEIPFLKAAGLERVPGYRTFPGTDLEDPSWRTDALDWQQELIRYREWKHARCETSGIEADGEHLLCSLSPNYFGAMYGWIEEPRTPTQRAANVIPFAPYHFQVHATDLRMEVFDSEEERDLYQPKSREMGVTWNNMKDDAWYWLYRRARILLVSRDQNTVWKKGDMGAFMSKIVFILNNLPPYIIRRACPGFDPTLHTWYKKNLLDNLHSGAQIVGTANSADIARGDRFLFADFDETQTMRNLEEVVSSAAGASYHLCFTFTESLETSRENLDRWQAAKRLTPENVLELNWHQNAKLDEATMARKEARAVTPEAKMKFKREYYRDPWAGHGDWVYPEARELPDADRPYTPDQVLHISLDPAGTGDDVAFIAGQPTHVDGQDGFHTLFTYQRRLPNPEWMAHVLTGIWPEPGDECFGQRPDPDEDAIGKHLFELWLYRRRINYFMDPAGDQNSSNVSYKKMLEKKSGELRKRAVARMVVERERLEAQGQDTTQVPPIPPPMKISPQCDWLKRARNRLHGERQFALRRYIRHLTFQRGVLSADWARTCLAEYKYRPQTTNAVSQPVPTHDQFSHIASCFEHWALYAMRGFRDPVAITDVKVPTGRGQHRNLPNRTVRVAPSRTRSLPTRAPDPVGWR